MTADIHLTIEVRLAGDYSYDTAENVIKIVREAEKRLAAVGGTEETHLSIVKAKPA